MTNKEREYASLGYEHAVGIEQASTVWLLSGRQVFKKGDQWEVQPWNDNYWLTFDNLIDAIKCGTRPTNLKESHAQA
jgi:hypothetical protein